MPRHPSKAAIASVLRRLSVDPATRIDDLDQDAEYTACRPEELERYLELYGSADLAPEERDVLACFMFQTLNDLAAQDIRSRREAEVVRLLLSTPAHDEERAYWMNAEDPDEENWWPVTKVLLRYG